MKIRNLQLSIASLTSSIVLVLAVMIGAGITTWNPLHSDQSLSNERTPANVITLESLDNAVDSLEKSVTYDLKCLRAGKVDALKSSAKQVRITGQICGDDLPNSHVVNRTNGIEALVFRYKGQKFSTDYIDLAIGPNQIHVKLSAESGESLLAEVTVIRE